MDGWFEFAWSNTLTASLLAAAALVAGGLFRRPALTHALWVLVLVKLVTPGIAEIPIPTFWLSPAPLTTAQENPDERWTDAALAAKQVAAGAANGAASSGGSWAGESPVNRRLWPRDWRAGSRSLARRLTDWSDGVRGNPRRVALGPADTPLAHSDESAPAPGAAAPSGQQGVAFAARRVNSRAMASLDINGPLIGLWWSGSLIWFTWSAWRVWRFRSWMRSGWLAPREIQRLTESLARRMKLPKAPRVFLASAPISPMVFWWGRAPRLLFPAELACRLDRAALESLLQHELAHLKRRDHWVRLVELAVTGLYWWHPLVWLARRRLHCAEEECCDAMVVAQSRSGGRTYALAVLSTLDFLAEWRPTFPPAACGLGRAGLIRRRLLLIMQGSVEGRLSRPGRAAVALACLALPVSLHFVAMAPRASATATANTLVKTSVRAPRGEAPSGQPIDSASLQGSTVSPSSSWSQVVIDQTAILVEGDLLVAAEPPLAAGDALTGTRLRAWRLDSHELVFEAFEQRQVAALTVSPGGEWIVWATGAEVVKFASLSLDDESPRVSAPAPYYVGETVTALAVSRDLNVLALADARGQISLWNPGLADETGRLSLHSPGRRFSAGASILSLSLSDDGTTIGAVAREQASGEAFAVAWRPDARGMTSPAAQGPIAAVAPEAGGAIDALISPDGRHLAVLDANGECQVWQLPGGASDNSRPRLSATYHHLSAIGLSANGQFAVLSNRSSAARIWSVLAISRHAAEQRSAAPYFAVTPGDGGLRFSSAGSIETARAPGRLSRHGELVLFVGRDGAGRAQSLEIWK